MALEMIVILSLALALAVLLFAIILQFIREDTAHCQQLVESAQTNQLLQALLTSVRMQAATRAQIAAETRGAVEAERNAMLRDAARAAETTRPGPQEEDGDVHDRPTVFYEVTKVSATMPALGEDEEEDTRTMTRVGPPPVRGR